MNSKPLADWEKKGQPLRIKVNGLDFAFEKKLYKKLIVMSERITKKHPVLDACLINEGYEGEGKTNSSLIEAVIVQDMISKVHKDTSIHLFFKTSTCIEFAKRTHNKIIILDEPALESLSTDNQNSLNKDFLRLTSTMRKKRHFLIINFAKFWKFPEFLVVDRALGMVRMQSKNGKDPGRFVYIRKKNLEKLWNDKKKSNQRSFRKYRAFGGRMPFLMPEIFEKFNIQVEGKMNATMDDYDNLKDSSIESIGEVKTNKKDEDKDAEIRKKKAIIRALVLHPASNQVERARQVGISLNSIMKWDLLSTIGGDVPPTSPLKDETLLLKGIEKE